MLLLKNADCKVNGKAFFGVVVNHNEDLDVISIITECGVSDVIIHIDDVEFASFENDTDYFTVENGRVEHFWFVNPKNFNRIFKGGF